MVTGTAATGGLKKIDTSYSVTSATLDQIREFNPKSSADLLKMAPGVFPESSGGQTGANIEVAGFPGGGDAPFVTFQLNGSPLYPMPTLSFMDNSSMFRLDDTIDHAEFVLGGPAVLYGNGQPGLTANFILREGTDKPSGDVGVTYGSEGLVRLDGFYGFKIADNWYGSIGGFWRKSDGVRDPQFDADKGGSLTGTLTRYGRITEYGSTSYLDDVVYPHKWILDLAASYRLDRWSFTLGADNVFNTYPKRTPEDQDNDGVFPYSSSSPFGFQGAYVYGKVAYRW